MLTFLPAALRTEQGGVAEGVAEADVCRLPAPVSGRALERVSLRADALCGCGCLISRTEVHDLCQDYGFNIVPSYAKSDSRLPPVFASATNRATFLLPASMVPLGGFPFWKTNTNKKEMEKVEFLGSLSLVIPLLNESKVASHVTVRASETSEARSCGATERCVKVGE